MCDLYLYLHHLGKWSHNFHHITRSLLTQHTSPPPLYSTPLYSTPPSIWYGATVRGDVNAVTIGDHTSIGDRAVVHVAKIQGDFPTTIGNRVTVGPCAIVHAATLEDGVVIGAGAQVLDGAKVHANAMVAPGAVVTPGTVVPGGELWAGAPAKMVRVLAEEDFKAMEEMKQEQQVLAQMHAFENAKDYEQLAKDEEELKDSQQRAPDYWQPKHYVDTEDYLGQGKPGYIFNTTLTHPEEGLKFLQERALKAEEAMKKAQNK